MSGTHDTAGRPGVSAPRGRRRGLGWWLLLALVVVPLVEVYVLVQVGQVIGAGWAILALLAISVLGGWILKREGVRAWRALQVALGEGRVPTTEIADGSLVVLGGALMLAPGFVTDAVGLVLVLPFTRPLLRGLVASRLARSVLAGPVGFDGAGGPLRPEGPWTARRPGPGPGGPVVRGEVVDDDRG